MPARSVTSVKTIWGCDGGWAPSATTARSTATAARPAATTARPTATTARPTAGGAVIVNLRQLVAGRDDTAPLPARPLTSVTIAPGAGRAQARRDCATGHVRSFGPADISRSLPAGSRHDTCSTIP